MPSVLSRSASRPPRDWCAGPISGTAYPCQVTTEQWLVVGLDNGGTKNNATVLASDGTFLVDSLIETPSRVQDGPEVAIDCLALAFEDVLAMTGVDRADVRA